VQRHIYRLVTLFALFGLAGCGGGGSDKVIVLNPGDGLPIESFYGMDAADVNSDGLTDIVAISNYFDGRQITQRRLNVFLQDASAPGSFLPPARYLHEQGTVYNIRLADLALDGRPAVIGQSYSTGGFMVFEPDPAMPGAYLAPVLFQQPAIGVFGAFDIADMDGDLYPDLVATDDNERISQLLQLVTTPVSFAAPQDLAEGSTGLDAQDVNGDGATDLVTFRQNERSGGFGGTVLIPDTVLVHVQDASQPGQYFNPVEIFFDTVGGDVVAADLNGDGRAEIVISAAAQIDNDITHHLYVYRQIVGPQFVLQDRLLTGGDIITGHLDVADVDGDGKPEIVAGYRNAALDPNLVEVFAQNASGNYVSRALITLPNDRALSNPEMFAVRLADLNDDGLLDIAVSTYELFVLFQNPAAPGTFRAPTRIAGQR